MSKHISIRIAEATQGRFFTVKTKNGGVYNGKLNSVLTNISPTMLYINQSHDGLPVMIRRKDVIQINGENCKIAIEG